jgi:phosphinothricin acetyltransferase
MIRPATTDDVEQITTLYNHYVENTVITFEEDRLSATEMATRIAGVTETDLWLVSEQQGSITGYAYATPFDSRPAYRHAVETTVYLAPEHVGQGVGSKLYRALLDQLRVREFHCAIGRIALPNDASVALHEKFGFVKVAQLKDVGRKFDQWIDVGYWELLL